MSNIQGEKGEGSRQGEEKLCLYLLGCIKWQLLSRSMHNWVGILLWKEVCADICPTAHCWWWNIEALQLHHKSLCNSIRCQHESSFKRSLRAKDAALWIKNCSRILATLCLVWCLTCQMHWSALQLPVSPLLSLSLLIFPQLLSLYVWSCSMWWFALSAVLDYYVSAHFRTGSSEKNRMMCSSATVNQFALWATFSECVVICEYPVN